MSGLSNACYRVQLSDEVQLPELSSDSQEPRVILYRKFECEIINKQIETAIFKTMSDSGLGPKLIF